MQCVPYSISYTITQIIRVLTANCIYTLTIWKKDKKCGEIPKILIFSKKVQKLFNINLKKNLYE